MENPRTDKDGTKKWYNSKGELHRLEGPAVEYTDGGTAWYVDGKRHRLEAPAIEGAEGSKAWWVYGKLHRLDGPAREGVADYKEWWVDGEKVTKKNYPQAVLLYKCKMILES